MNKLKPCPFCGGTDIEIKDEEKWSYIWCGDCLSAFWQREACSVEDNVEAWNKRTIITKHDPDIRITDIIVWTMAFIGIVCIIAKWFA